MEWPGLAQLKPNWWDTLTPEQQRERTDDFQRKEKEIALKRLAKGDGGQPTDGGGGKPIWLGII